MPDTCQSLVALSDDDRVTIETMLRQRTLSPRLRERLEMVKSAGLGHELGAIAAWGGRSVETVRYWLARFAEGGIPALADAPRSGRPVKADSAYVAAMEQAVATSPTELGLPFDVWTSARLSAYLAEETGVTIAPGWLRALLARQHFACGRPKHTLHHLQDPEDVARCERELAIVGEKGGGSPRAL